MAAAASALVDRATRGIQLSLQSDEEAEEFLRAAATTEISLTGMSLFLEVRQALFGFGASAALREDADHDGISAAAKEWLLTCVERSSGTSAGESLVAGSPEVRSAARTLAVLLCDVQSNPSFLVQGAEQVRRDMQTRVLLCPSVEPGHSASRSLIALQHVRVEAAAVCALATYLAVLLGSAKLRARISAQEKNVRFLAADAALDDLTSLDRTDLNFYKLLKSRVTAAAVSATAVLDRALYSTNLLRDTVTRVLSRAPREGEELAMVEAVVLTEYLLRGSLCAPPQPESAEPIPAAGPDRAEFRNGNGHVNLYTDDSGQEEEEAEVGRQDHQKNSVAAPPLSASLLPPGNLLMPRLGVAPSYLCVGPGDIEPLAFVPNAAVGPVSSAATVVTFPESSSGGRIVGMTAVGKDVALFFASCTASPTFAIPCTEAAATTSFGRSRFFHVGKTCSSQVTSSACVVSETAYSGCGVQQMGLLCTTGNGELWRFDLNSSSSCAAGPAELTRDQATHVLSDPTGLRMSLVCPLGYGLAAVGPVLRIVHTTRGGDHSSNPFLRFHPPPGEGTASGMAVSSMAAYCESQLAVGRFTSSLLLDVATGAVLAPAPSLPDGGCAVTAMACTFRESVVAIGASDGVVRLWDPRMGPRSFVRSFLPVLAPSYLRSSPVSYVAFGARGLHSMFLHHGSSTGANRSPLQLYAVGYEKAPVWQSSSEVSHPAIGVVEGKTYAHCFDSGIFRSFDVTNLC
jgi:hypothetical protein